MRSPRPLPGLILLGLVAFAPAAAADPRGPQPPPHPARLAGPAAMPTVQRPGTPDVQVRIPAVLDRRAEGLSAPDAADPVPGVPAAAQPMQAGGPAPPGTAEPAAQAGGSGVPMAVSAKSVPSPVGTRPEDTLSLPFEAGTAAASFRRGDSAYVVFDARRPIDMAPLRNSLAFGSATVSLLPAATVLRLKLPVPQTLRLARIASGWTLTIVDAAPAAADPPPPVQPIRPELASDGLLLPADQPGGVVSMPDPDSGLAVLIGTLKQPGRAFPLTRRMPEFELSATWQGVVLDPVSDQIGMRSTDKGFLVVPGAGRSLAYAPPSADVADTGDANNFSRDYDFPALPADSLLRRLQFALGASANTPQQARGPRRLEVAQAMLALGMGAEAQSIIAVATTDDGRLANQPAALGLGAIAAIMAERLDEAEAINDPRLDGNDEIALWRAALAAMRHEGTPEAAAVFAAEMPLLLSYPPALRDRLLPLAVETMALAGERAAARAVLASRPDDHQLDLARGMLLQADAVDGGGAAKPALEAYAKVVQGPDRLARARAASRAVELDLATGGLTPAQAADALEKQLYAWRGDEREVNLRIRVAELRRQSGGWRPALALLRETEQLWPEQKPALQTRLTQTFAQAIDSDAKAPMAPLDLVALAEENADLIPDGDAGQAIAARLAERLVALDLPRRAVPVLEKLMGAAPAGPARAEFGAKLAAVRLADGDARAALTALNRSDAPGLPPALSENRTLTFARAAAAAGDLTSASAVLAALDTTPAAALRADLLEGGKDWQAAEAALRDLAARTVPEQGPLDEAQARTLLRLASAAAQTGDEATLAALREHDQPRLPQGKIAEMFRVLTAGPVQGVSDLPRAAQEMKLARALPTALKTLTP